MSKRSPGARGARQRPRSANAQLRSSTNPLHRYTPLLFAGFVVAMLVAFWPSYFSRLGDQPSYHPHAHGLAMSAWCLLLVSQAWLIRVGSRDIHRGMGAASYVLVPVMMVATLNFLHFRVREAQELGPVGLYMVALIVNGLIAFLVLYALAMAYRRQPAVHGRFMVCTVFPLFTPVTDRLIGRFWPSLVPLVPRIDGAPVLPVVGFLLADVMLLALSVWDWRANKRAVFPVALVVLLAYHGSVLTFHQFAWWAAFGRWFVSLPLS